jgi:hypothetical protein
MVSDSVTKWLATKLMRHSLKQYGTAVKAWQSFCPLTDFVGNLLIKLPGIREKETTQTPSQLVEKMEMIAVIIGRKNPELLKIECVTELDRHR